MTVLVLHDQRQITPMFILYLFGRLLLLRQETEYAVFLDLVTPGQGVTMWSSYATAAQVSIDALYSIELLAVSAYVRWHIVGVSWENTEATVAAAAESALRQVDRRVRSVI